VRLEQDDTAIPRPLFLYRALPLLAWALAGDPAKENQVLPLTEPATFTGLSCFSIIGMDYPALVRHEPTSALRSQTKSQRLTLYDFEGESYTVTPVTVIVETNGT
jgi:hypothetical protein